MRCHLEGQHFTLETDHHPLIYLQTHSTLSKKQARWLELFQQYSFTVKHTKGTDNCVADVLSRLRATATSVLGHQLAWVDDVRKAQQEDTMAMQARKGMQVTDTLWTEQNGLLYFAGKLYIPEGANVQGFFMNEAHASLSAGHLANAAVPQSTLLLANT